MLKKLVSADRQHLNNMALCPVFIADCLCSFNIQQEGQISPHHSTFPPSVVILGNLCGTLIHFLLSRYCESLIDCSKVPLEPSYVPRLLLCIDTPTIVIQASLINTSLGLDLK